MTTATQTHAALMRNTKAELAAKVMSLRQQLGEIETTRDGPSITDRKRAEDELADSRERLQALADNLPDFISMSDPEGRYLFVNKCWEEWTCLDRNDVVGKTVFDIYPEEQATKVDAFDQRALDSRKVVSDEFNVTTADGKMRTVIRTRFSVISSQGEMLGLGNINHDITERKKAEEQIKNLANHDALTGLPSLRLGRDRLSGAIARARRNKSLVALMFVDLDGFKAVNDTLGHEAGDHVLKEVAARLSTCLRETDTVARIGGDEFTIILTDVEDKTAVAIVAEKVLKILSQSIGHQGQDASIGASIGIALYPDHGDAPEELLKRADEAMYAVKRKGKNSYSFA